MMSAQKLGIVISVFLIGIFSVFYFSAPVLFPSTYYTSAPASVVSQEKASFVSQIVATHLKTPEPLKAIYMTSCFAGSPSLRTRLVEMVEATELNALVIDVKDYSGTISYYPENPMFSRVSSTGCRVPDMREFLAVLHEKGIYTIARISVFQDPLYTHAHPELAVKKKSDGSIWKDRKGLSFIDVSAEPYWEYIAMLARDAYAIGFDEINFDYIRFPSDGDMKDIQYPWTGTTTKAVALEKFFRYLEHEVKPVGAVISADLFGMTTTNRDDLNIGQVLEPALRHFDYVAPMVYPSHYPANFNGWANPNKHVYDIIRYSMDKAVARAKVASTTPLKLRPWLQDFDYGGNYGPVEVRAQIQATYDAGLTSWMLWDPNNKYTPAALLK